MAKTSTSVGNEALSYCTSCKMDLGHTIVAMSGDRIAKVQCRTCKKEHTYRAPKGVKDPSAPATKKAPRQKKEATPKANPVEVEWRERMLQSGGVAAKTYSPKEKFISGEKLRHPTFGEGVVTKTIHPNKVEVIFEMDLKVLIHAGNY